MRVTRHFGIWEWVDFVRGVGDSAARSAMGGHLASGCQRCEEIVRTLGGFAAMAMADAAYEPSGRTVARAVALFPRRRPENVVVPTLIYDSFLKPLPAGLRAQDRPARHTLYEAGNICLDLQLDQEPASGLVSLVGQLSDREKGIPGAVNLPVLVMARKRLVASTTCNRLGEFQLQYEPARELRLHVPLHGRASRLDINLDELSPQPPRRRRKPKLSRLRTSSRRTR